MRASAEVPYQAIFDASPLPTWVSEVATGRMLLVNQAALREYGFERDEFLALTTQSLRPDGARTRRSDPSPRRAPLPAEFALEREHRRRDGSVFPVRLQVAPLTLDGIPAQMTVSLDAELAEIADAEAVRRARSMQDALELAEVGHWESDLTSGETSWSDELYRLYGAERSVAPVLSEFLSRVHDEDRAVVAAAIEKAIAAREVHFEFFCRVVHPDGSVRWLKNRHLATYDSAGALVSIRGTVQDITKKRITELALVESERQHRMVTENATDIVSVSDDTGVVTFVSPSVERILGYSPATLIGKRMVGFVHPDDQSLLAPDPAEDFAEHGAPHVVEFRFKHLDGSWRVLEAVSQSHTDASGAVNHVVNARDVTDRRKVEARLRILAGDLAVSQHEVEAATAAKSAFLATMSHEIRTPMNAVLGLTELVLDGELSSEQRRHLLMVHDAGDVLMTLLNDILDLSKIEAEHIVLEAIPISVGDVLNSAMSLLATRARESGLVARVEIAPDVPRVVRGDPTRLRQVLVNLIGNAVKFTAEGEVVAQVSVLDARDGAVSLRFAVRDTGVGIPTEQLAAVFKDFSQADASTTREYGGTGLGLSISRRLVQLMGGELSVTSTVGEGSEFFFTISLPVEASPAQEVGAPVRLAGVRALVVDRDSVDRRLVREILSPLGASVTEASNGSAAIAALDRARDEQVPFAVVLIDSQLSESDGIALAATIRARPELGTTHILMLTSSEQRTDVLSQLPRGTAGFVVKPISRNDLVAATASLVAHDRKTLSAPSGQSTSAPLRILLAEDNLVNQEVAGAMLRRRGHIVTIANDGAQAVAAATAGEFDLVMMDIHMPVMDGLDATRAIRALPVGPTLPIVAVTADASPSERERCLAAGLDDYLTKPFTAKALLDVIEGAVARRAVGAKALPSVGRPRALSPVRPRDDRPVDVDAFRATMREADAEDAVDGILDTFLADAPRRSAMVLAALESGDGPRIRTEAHAFKSAAASIGAHDLAAHLLAIELAGRDGRTADARALADNVRDGADAVVRYLRDLRSPAGVP